MTAKDPKRIYERKTEDGYRTRALLYPDGRVQIRIDDAVVGLSIEDVLSREERIDLARALLADVEPAAVHAVCEYSNCEGDHDGNVVVELYASKQTAEQHQSRLGPLSYVRKLDVRTKLREY